MLKEALDKKPELQKFKVSVKFPVTCNRCGRLCRFKSLRSYTQYGI